MTRTFLKCTRSHRAFSTFFRGYTRIPALWSDPGAPKRTPDPERYESLLRHCLTLCNIVVDSPLWFAYHVRLRCLRIFRCGVESEGTSCTAWYRSISCRIRSRLFPTACTWLCSCAQTYGNVIMKANSASELTTIPSDCIVFGIIMVSVV